MFYIHTTLCTCRLSHCIPHRPDKLHWSTVQHCCGVHKLHCMYMSICWPTKMYIYVVTVSPEWAAIFAEQQKLLPIVLHLRRLYQPQRDLKEKDRGRERGDGAERRRWWYAMEQLAATMSWYTSVCTCIRQKLSKLMYYWQWRHKVQSPQSWLNLCENHKFKDGGARSRYIHVHTCTRGC